MTSIVLQIVPLQFAPPPLKKSKKKILFSIIGWLLVFFRIKMDVQGPDIWSSTLGPIGLGVDGYIGEVSAFSGSIRRERQTED